MTADITEIEVKETDVSQLVELSKNNVFAIKGMSEHLVKYTDKVDKMADAVTSLKEDIVEIKENEEITTIQASELQRLVSRKVYSLLSDSEAVIYARKLFSDCWRYLGNFGCLRPYATTPKRDYKNIVAGLKTYDPDLKMLKAEVDKSNRIVVQYQNSLRAKEGVE